MIPVFKILLNLFVVVAIVKYLFTIEESKLQCNRFYAMKNVQYLKQIALQNELINSFVIFVWLMNRPKIPTHDQ